MLQGEKQQFSHDQAETSLSTDNLTPKKLFRRSSGNKRSSTSRSKSRESDDGVRLNVFYTKNLQPNTDVQSKSNPIFDKLAYLENRSGDASKNERKPQGGYAHRQTAKSLQTEIQILKYEAELSQLQMVRAELIQKINNLQITNNKIVSEYNAIKQQNQRLVSSIQKAGRESSNGLHRLKANIVDNKVKELEASISHLTKCNQQLTQDNILLKDRLEFLESMLEEQSNCADGLLQQSLHSLEHSHQLFSHSLISDSKIIPKQACLQDQIAKLQIQLQKSQSQRQAFLQSNLKQLKEELYKSEEQVKQLNIKLNVQNHLQSKLQNTNGVQKNKEYSNLKAKYIKLALKYQQLQQQIVIYRRKQQKSGFMRKANTKQRQISPKMQRYDSLTFSPE